MANLEARFPAGGVTLAPAIASAPGGASSEAKFPAVTVNAAVPWSAQQLVALTQLARVYVCKKQFVDAKNLLHSVKQILKGNPPGGESDVEIRILLEEGRLQSLEMNMQKALANFGAAWELAEKQKVKYLAIDAALMLSYVAPPKMQSAWFERALSMAEASQEERVQLWRSHLYVLKAWQEVDLCKFSEALEYFEKAIQLVKGDSDSGKRSLPLKNIEWGKARAMRHLNQTADALAIQFRLQQESVPDEAGSGYIFLEIAECLRSMNQSDEAKEYFELAYNQLSKDRWFQDNRAADLSRIQALYKKRG